MSCDTKWLDTVVSKIVENISPHMKDVRYELTKTDHRLMSDMYFVCVKCTHSMNQLSEERFFVIKKSIPSNDTVCNTDVQFHNEILFFQRYRQLGENFPRCFYTYEPTSDSDDNCSIIALEDVSKSGFAVCPTSVNASYEYVLAVMCELGRFHAKGYVMRERNPTELFRIVAMIEETRYNVPKGKYLKILSNRTSTRAVKYLRKNGYDEEFCDKMEVLLSNVFDEVMLPVVEQRSEPLSTICHGDVTLDNILFKDQDNWKTKAMLIDFGLLRYGTPVIDLSTFLCLSCSSDVMRDKFHDILAAYHIALTNYMLEEGSRDVQKYSYNAILEDYKRGCLFGFAIASFFLPHLLGYFGKFPSTCVDFEPIAKEINQSGGDSVSKPLADMLLQMRDLGALDRFL